LRLVPDRTAHAKRPSEAKPRPDVVGPDGVPSRASVMQQPRAITVRFPGEYFVSGAVLTTGR
jgi:hypothetical protein